MYTSESECIKESVMQECVEGHGEKVDGGIHEQLQEDGGGSTRES